ncbi:phytoene synthase [Novosphingobium kunmingense]|uniref:Phytoene synthase n=1 Tax=Novosphingobium kunmingense TaxID=1211806 RepID=A0A2N0I4B4_9SPHN|nr:phytoene/squalene synthase family protein [Novosphingobium kunmingense]PKB26005.1 phytoene synthase [Novosphingobium kunmingense]
MTERAELVAAARDTIARGSQSFAAASRLFAPATREKAWLLYAWCRAADDMTDGQDLGQGGGSVHDPLAAQAQLQTLTDLALDCDAPVPLPFAALRQVARETAMPRAFIADHLAGFALDAADWRPRSEDDLLRYCYHVAGSVGCMMAVVMGVAPDDADTLDRACDLGLAFQLANIARDVVPDAKVGRCYLPMAWLERFGLREADLAAPQHRAAVAEMAARLVRMAQPYRLSARIGAARLAPRSRLAVLAADGIYGAIGEKVRDAGTAAWDERVRVSGMGKLVLLGQAIVRGLSDPPASPRNGLWQRPA